jgi:limonene-1,2-epoxide hydrolase
MQPVERFKEIFNRLNRESIPLVDELYSPDVLFIDPIHEVRGIANLRAYFQRLYDGVVTCRFDFQSEAVNGEEAMLTWVMHMQHGRFRKGETVHLPGASHIRFGEKVSYHRDYFDAGALIYERVPLLGGLIRGIKANL